MATRPEVRTLKKKNGNTILEYTVENGDTVLNAFTMKSRAACVGRLCGRHCVSMLTRNLHV